MSNEDENRWPAPDEPTRRDEPNANDTAEHVWTPPHGGGYSGSAYSAPPTMPVNQTPPPVPPVPPYGMPYGAPYGAPAAPEGPKRKKATRFLPWVAVALVAALIGGSVGALTNDNDNLAGGARTPLTLAPAAAAQTATPSSIRSVLEIVQPAVVSIQVRTPRGSGSGTGMIISPDGEILTNAHVVQGATAISVTLNNQSGAQPARLLGADISIDSAIIKLENASDLPTVTFGDANGAQVGDQVVAIGNALGLPGGPTVTTGIISGKERTTPDATGSGQLDNLIQTDAAINPGNSGGPLANLAGQVIGMNTEVIRGPNGEYENIGFALSMNTVQPALEDLRAGRTIERPYLGVSTVTVDAEIKNRFELTPDKGALVASVNQGSPAAKGGLNATDVIVAFDGTAIEDAAGLVNAVRAKRVGDRSVVEYYRGAERREVTVTLEARPTANLLR